MRILPVTNYQVQNQNNKKQNTNFGMIKATPKDIKSTGGMKYIFQSLYITLLSLRNPRFDRFTMFNDNEWQKFQKLMDDARKNDIRILPHEYGKIVGNFDDLSISNIEILKDIQTGINGAKKKTKWQLKNDYKNYFNRYIGKES